MTSIYLVRHALAKGNVERRFQGRTDNLLAEEGRLQVRLVARRFSVLPIQAVYTSPLLRAAETARGIANAHKLDPIVDEGLTEIDGGDFEDRLFDELVVEYPEVFHQFEHEPHKFKGLGGGESTAEVYERMKRTVLDIVKKNKGSNIVIVSHGCAIRCFLCYALGYPLERMNEIAWGGNTCVAHVLFDGSFSPKVCDYGDDLHLPPAMRGPYVDPKQT